MNDLQSSLWRQIFKAGYGTPRTKRKREEFNKCFIFTFGVNMWVTPAPAPGRVIPRTKNIVSTIYGNIDVKYTTWNNERKCRQTFTIASWRQTYLSGALNALHHDEEDDDPGQEEAQYYPPFRHARIFDGRGGIQGDAVPVVRRRRRLVAFRNHGAVYARTVFPR